MTEPTWPTVMTPAHAALSTAAKAGSTLSKVWTKMVTTGMGIHTTPAPAALPSTTIEAWTRSPLPLVTVTKAADTGATLSEALTEMVTEDIDQDDGAFAALIAGIVCFTLLVICIIVWRWHLSRHKGSYVTNEMDDDDDMDDEESVGSNTALQSREPLETKEDA
ncbi:cell adhesion molecule 2 isoform X5 [Perca flavescens]|uniref:cell adhesion molecule 2 isoform X5 n=1 Tax=Perca flavescens TaxID=8167 RepID=UPI00106EA891|nr:cell adhesion molecule 2-like isoform X5 [Perca flavescens]